MRREKPPDVEGSQPKDGRKNKKKGKKGDESGDEEGGEGGAAAGAVPRGSRVLEAGAPELASPVAAEAAGVHMMVRWCRGGAGGNAGPLCSCC